MNKLGNETITLRALEPEDVSLLYQWENDPEIWKVSNTIAPFSKYILTQFIESQTQDIFQTRQLRLVIESNEEAQAVGSVDLFDFDPHNRRAGIGILIYRDEDRGRGFARQAIETISDYCFKTLKLHQIYCNIPSDNPDSLSLFLKQGFSIAGIKRDWLQNERGWIDEYLLTKISR